MNKSDTSWAQMTITPFNRRILIWAAAGLYLAMWPWEQWPIVPGVPLVTAFLQHGLPKVGDALIIAVTLALLVDRAIKLELLDDFARDITHHVLGHLLPPELREHIFHYLSFDFLRASWEITYTMELLEDKPGHVRIATKSEHTVENRSKCWKQYECAYYVEKSWIPAVGETQILAFGLIAPEENNSFAFTIGGEELGRPQQKDNFMFVARTIKLPPAPHGEYKVYAESVEFFTDANSAYFVARYPVLKTSVTILYPKAELQVDVMLSDDDRGTARRVELSGGTKWEFRTPLLPGQSFVTRWGRTNHA
jgi:hypothetical protein